MAYTTIDDPSAYFQIALYTGNQTARSITNDGNSNLQPDWIWDKNRNTSGYHHNAYDSSRGVGKQLRPNKDDAEISQAQGVTAFNSDGFSLGTDDSSNKTNSPYVAWQWKANGGTTSTNTAGTNIDTTVQANTTSGFSIMTYTGTGTDNDSLGHGLGAVPHVIAVKNRDEQNGWQVYHHKNTSSPETDYLNFNDNGATADDSDRWSDQAPSSTIITLGGNDGVSKANVKYVCYAWTEIQGYSKFGSYTGNGNADGAFIYTGFKPAWLMVKKTNETEAWFIADSKRTPINPNDDILEANDSAAEGASTTLDLLSNGFKFRHENGNTTDDSYIYMAFAEHPFVSSKGVPCTAR